MSANNGGPASPPMHDPETHVSVMTLRDYFAAKAMQGIVAGVMSLGQNTAKEHAEQFATAAYMQADAMLKARES